MTTNTQHETPNILKGSLYGLLAFFCMAIFGVFTKVGLESASAFWVSFIAYLAATLILIPFILRSGWSYLKSEHYPFLFGRAIFGTIASFLYTISMHDLPIVNGTLLFNTAPLFIPLLATIFLKMKISIGTWMAVLIGFIGVIIVIKPTEEIFTQSGDLIGISSGIFLAIAYLLMKLLTKTDPGIRIIFYYLGLGTLLQIPLLFFVNLPEPGGIMYAAFAGIALLAAQMSLVTGYKYAEASQIGIYQYSTVVFVGLFDWWLWHAVPTTGEIIGAMLIAFAGILVIRSGREVRE